MLNSKKIIALLVVLLVVIGICVIPVQASDIIDLDNLIQSNQTTNTNTVNETNTNSLYSNTTTNTVTNTTANTMSSDAIVQPNVNKTSTSGNNLPQTGVTEDITVMFFIIVCVILAIYAYKKIKDYNKM